MPLNRPSTGWMTKRKLECYPCLEQAGDRCYACCQSAHFIFYWLWSFLLRHLATAASTGLCQHNTPIGVHFLWPGPTCWNINRQWCSIFFRAILAVPEKVGCVASVLVCLCASGKRHSREEPPVYKSYCSQEAMVNPRSGLLV